MINFSERHNRAVLPLIAILLAVGFALLFGGSTLEDAQITFRYARNLANGAGVGIWNLGQPPVEGCTSFLWMCILGTGMAAKISPFLLSKIIGLGAYLAIIALFFAGAACATSEGSGIRNRMALRNAGILLAFYIPLAWYSVSGMEAAFFAFLVALLVVSGSCSTLSLGWTLSDTLASSLLILTRPEGILISLCFALFRVFRTGKLGERAKPAILRYLPLFAIACTAVLFEIYRYVHFGDFLPNTYYAKASGNPLRYLHFGVVYVAMFLVGTFPIWIAFLAGGVLAVRRKDWSSYETFLLCLLLVYVAYVLKVGGDPPWAFPFWRHLVHIVPIWIFLAGAAITRFNSQPQRGVGLSFGIGASTAAILLLYVYLPGHMFPGSHTPGFETKAPQHPYFQFIDRFVDQQTITAASLAGQWGWYVPANIIDILGLNDRHIAHYGHYQERGVMDSKTDMLYVMNQHPDVIDAYVSGQKIERGVCPTEQIAARRNMIAGIVHYPNVLDDYYFVSNAPYDVLDRSLLVSGRIAPRAIASGAKLILLKNTVLGNDTCVP